jgi:PAS domain S-box-containing protein
MLSSKPTGKEIKLSSKDMLVSKTDLKGIIKYGNSKFVEIVGYKETELIGSPHNILRHPDMPKALFYLMWKSIKNGQNIMAVVKNKAKNGDHYWVTTDFVINRDRSGAPKSYTAFRYPASKKVVREIEPLYKKMLEIEKFHSMDESVEYLESFLEEKNLTYNQYIEYLAKPKGLTVGFFDKLKKVF